MNFVDTTKIEIKKVELFLAKEFIEKHHYTHKLGLCRVAYGIFYDTEKNLEFFEGNQQDFIGVIVYSQPVGRSAAESISNLISVYEVFELTRLACLDDVRCGKNLESYAISQSIKLLKKDFPEIKAIITYADGEQGHKGTIYQACGFDYQGNSSLALMPNFSISLVGPPYKWTHSRTVSSTYGTHNVERIKKKIRKTFWRKKESTKHRYVCLLGNKTDRKKILSNLKHPFLPYPKSNNYVDEIEEIKVDDTTENQFFG